MKQNPVRCRGGDLPGILRAHGQPAEPDLTEIRGRLRPYPGSALGHGASRMRVVSFNIKLADRIDAAIEVLGSDSLRDADIISLQEMDESGTERIARALHLNYIYYPGSIHPTRNRYFGPAILSRWPIEKSWKLTLPYEAPIRRQRRNATAAIVNVRWHPDLGLRRTLWRPSFGPRSMPVRTRPPPFWPTRSARRVPSSLPETSTAGASGSTLNSRALPGPPKRLGTRSQSFPGITSSFGGSPCRPRRRPVRFARFAVPAITDRSGPVSSSPTRRG